MVNYNLILNILNKESYLVSCVIGYVVEPAMPFGRHLRSIITTLLCIFNPPVSSYRDIKFTSSDFHKT